MTNKNFKESGITLIALVITIVILIILATATINATFGENGLLKQSEKAKDITSNSIEGEEKNINQILSEYENIIAGGSQIAIPADGSYNQDKKVNSPKLGNNMELVMFDEEKQEWVKDKTNSEYSYIGKEDTGDNNQSKWANAKVTTQVNGQSVESYFVWIPRYAYKITYYTDESKQTISQTPTVYGTIDIKFIKGTGKEASDGTPCKYLSDNPTASDYIIHPAFTNDVDNGGWNSEIPGIWVAKYEASSVEGNTNTSEGDNTTEKHVKVESGVSSWRNIDIGNMYTVSYNYARELESHMLKNSEWGAVAYLTESKYGRNGTEVTINNNGETYYTGGGVDKAYISNVKQSTTGNVYGIYDLSGNSWEYVAAAYNNRNEIGTSDGSTKYATVYRGTNISSDFKKGDATYETSAWNGDNASFVSLNYPMFVRGGSFNNEDIAGIFYFGGHNGSGFSNYSFRLTLTL